MLEAFMLVNRRHLIYICPHCDSNMICHLEGPKASQDVALAALHTHLLALLAGPPEEPPRTG